MSTASESPSTPSPPPPVDPPIVVGVRCDVNLLSTIQNVTPVAGSEITQPALTSPPFATTGHVKLRFRAKVVNPPSTPWKGCNATVLGQGSDDSTYELLNVQCGTPASPGDVVVVDGQLPAQGTWPDTITFTVTLELDTNDPEDKPTV